MKRKCAEEALYRAQAVLDVSYLCLLKASNILSEDVVSTKILGVLDGISNIQVDINRKIKHGR